MVCGEERWKEGRKRRESAGIVDQETQQCYFHPVKASCSFDKELCRVQLALLCIFDNFSMPDSSSYVWCGGAMYSK